MFSTKSLWVQSLVSESNETQHVGRARSCLVPLQAPLSGFNSCLLILPGLLDRWDPLSAKLIPVRLSNPLFVGNWNLRVNMPRRHLKRSLPNTPRFPFFKERCCLWPRTQRCRAWETGSFSSGVGLLCLPQVTPTPTIPACRTGHGFIYFPLAQFGSTGFLSCSEQPHTCVK